MTFYEWLNQTFFDMDAAIFRATNELLNSCPFLEKVARFISYFGDKGYFFILLTIVLLVFRKTRKIGIVLAFGLLFNHILNNMILKNWIARPRPYNEVEEFKLMWQAHSTAFEKSFSFPSGHTSMATFVGGGLFIMLNKKYSWLFLFIPLLMGWSRIALFVHYPSDVLGGFVTGTIAVVASYFLFKLLMKWKFAENLTVGDKFF